ncbi:MAG: hypothetical protein QM516_13960, partial [Limnohabitans sp.]|nr:hypothetical protein [Limnohabitans sp.]
MTVGRQTQCQTIAPRGMWLTRTLASLLPLIAGAPATAQVTGDWAMWGSAAAAQPPAAFGPATKIFGGLTSVLLLDAQGDLFSYGGGGGS